MTPAHSEAKLPTSTTDLRLASTTASRGHSWRGDAHPMKHQTNHLHWASGTGSNKQSNKQFEMPLDQNQINIQAGNHDTSAHSSGILIQQETML